MLKQIGLALTLVAALMWSGTAFAQTPASIPPPTSITPIIFSPGTSSYTFTTNLAPGVSQGYVFWVAAQQAIYITKGGDADVEVLDPLGNVLATPTVQPGPWGAIATRNGNYTVVLYGQGPVTVSIYIPSTILSASLCHDRALFQTMDHFYTRGCQLFLQSVFSTGSAAGVCTCHLGWAAAYGFDPGERHRSRSGSGLQPAAGIFVTIWGMGLQHPADR